MAICWFRLGACMKSGSHPILSIRWLTLVFGLRAFSSGLWVISSGLWPFSDYRNISIVGRDCHRWQRFSHVFFRLWSEDNCEGRTEPYSPHSAFFLNNASNGDACFMAECRLLFFWNWTKHKPSLHWAEFLSTIHARTILPTSRSAELSCCLVLKFMSRIIHVGTF